MHINPLIYLYFSTLRLTPKVEPQGPAVKTCPLEAKNGPTKIIAGADAGLERLLALLGKEHSNQEIAMVGTSKYATSPSHLSTDDPHLDRLLNPAQFYKHPREIIDDPHLGLSEKRAILSS